MNGHCVTWHLFVIPQAWLPARAVVEQALQQRHEVDSSGEILRLSSACPWKEHLYDLEEELHISPYIKYCLYEVSMADVVIVSEG